MAERSVSTWSLHRTLGRFVAPDSAVNGGPFFATPPLESGMALLDLPAELQRRGYESVQVCHFHVPSRDADYLAAFRGSLETHGIALDTFLIDDGDSPARTPPIAMKRGLAAGLKRRSHSVHGVRGSEQAASRPTRTPCRAAPNDWAALPINIPISGSSSRIGKK